MRRVVLAKDEYSSRYDKLKAGELPNAFNPEFAAGSLMDLGVYTVALSRLLFGEPTSVHATGHLLPSGVDGQGTLLLGYDGFEVACLHSKIAPGGVGSAITGEAGVIHFDDCSVPTRVRLDLRDGTSRDLTREQSRTTCATRWSTSSSVCAPASSPPHGRSTSPWPSHASSTGHAQVGVHFPADA